MSDSMRPHRRQPTRLPCPWDSPGKNTGVGCHFLLQRMKVKSETEVAQSCLTLSNPMDCSPPGSSAHGIFQARVLEWVSLPSPPIRNPKGGINDPIAPQWPKLALCLKQVMVLSPWLTTCSLKTRLFIYNIPYHAVKWRALKWS